MAELSVTFDPTTMYSNDPTARNRAIRSAREFANIPAGTARAVVSGSFHFSQSTNTHHYDVEYYDNAGVAFTYTFTRKNGKQGVTSKFHVPQAVLVPLLRFWFGYKIGRLIMSLSTPASPAGPTMYAAIGAPERAKIAGILACRFNK